MRLGAPHEALAQSSITGYRLTIQARTSITVFVSAIIGSMCALVVLIGAGVFVPILLQIDRSADSIVLQFVRLPANVRMAMHAQMLSRVRLLRRQYAGDDEEDLLESDDEEAMGVGGPGGAGGFGGNGTLDEDGGAAAMVDEDGAGVDWDKVLATTSRRMVAAAANSGSDTDGRPSLVSPTGPGSARPSSVGRYRPTVPKAASVHPAPNSSANDDAIGVGDDSASDPHAGSVPSAASGGSSALSPARRTNTLAVPARGGAAASSSVPSFKRSSSSARGGRGTAVLAYRKSSRSFLMMFARFIGPLACLFILFVVVEAVFLVTISNTAALVSVSAAAAARASFARSAIINIRKLEYLGESRRVMTPLVYSLHFTFHTASFLVLTTSC